MDVRNHFFIDNYKCGIFLHCFTGSPALAQIRYDNLARTIFFSLWNGVPRIWNSNGSCVFVYQTGKLLESYHQNTAAFVSVHVFTQDQRDRTMMLIAQLYVCFHTCLLVCAGQN